MNDRIINLEDKYGKNLKEKVSVSTEKLRGEVSIFEKDKSGKLGRLLDRKNMIVFGGRNWLLQKAFGSTMDGSDSGIYNKEIRWFGIGNGGGEPGNPLQAGPSFGQDTGLYQPVRMRDDLTPSDPGYTLYASDYLGNHGYYKRFSSIVIKEDTANPYTVGNSTSFPALIAEIRIELSSDDANGGSYEDLNEAGLFVADPTVADPGLDAITGGGVLGTENVLKVSMDGDFAIYYMDSYDLATDMPGIGIGDYLWVSNATYPTDPNIISESGKLLIVDMYNGENAVRKGYIVVEKSGAIDADYSPTYPIATVVEKTVTPYIMFSRVTFSTLRKVPDREICFLWKIYF